MYKEINCESLTLKVTRKDPTFRATYCLDPYQNCEFRCIYCDSTNDIIYIKRNAPSLLEKEIKELEKGLVMVGFAHDPYQRAEQIFGITRSLLQVLKEYAFPCHILTKSTLILKDIDVISSMASIVTISLLSLNEGVARIFEEGVPSPLQRLETIEKLSLEGIRAGVALIVLPYLTDLELEEIIKRAKEHKARHFLYKHLELKGDQKRVFENTLRKHCPSILPKYRELYKRSYKPSRKYVEKWDSSIKEYCKKYGLDYNIKCVVE